MNNIQDNELAEILQKARQGDHEPLATALAPMVYNLVARLLRYDSESDDVAQEVMLVVVTKLHQLKEDEAFYGWLKKIITSKVASFVRRKVSQNCMTNMDDFVNGDGVSRTAEEIALAGENAVILREVVDCLDPLEKDVIVAFYFENQKIKEIAISQDVPVGTIKSRLDRAKTNLRARLAEIDY